MDSWRGGAETSTRQFTHHLMDAGVELHLFTRSRPSPAPELHVHSMNGAAMSRTRRSMTFAIRVERMLREQRFDVVHAISPCRGADIYQPRGGTVAETVERNVALRESNAGRQLKRIANRFNIKQRYMLRLERELMGEQDGPTIVAISDYVVRQLKRHYSLADERIRLIYNGVDPDPTQPTQRAAHRRSIRAEFGIPSTALLVLEVAHNFRLKGVGQWLQAMAMLHRKQAGELYSIVIGRGDTPQWHRRAETLGLSKTLTFIGPSDRVREFYHAADVLVHPTYYDPCSRVVLEALVSNLPCITTRWDGASEMIRDGVNGFVLDEPDADELSERVERLFDPGLRTQMIRSESNPGQRISMARHAADMLRLYEEVRSQDGEYR